MSDPLGADEIADVRVRDLSNPKAVEGSRPVADIECALREDEFVSPINAAGRTERETDGRECHCCQEVAPVLQGSLWHGCAAQENENALYDSNQPAHE